MAIQFFSRLDRKHHNPNGPIHSEYPVWYHPQRIAELEEEIASKKRQLQRGVIDERMQATYREEIARDTERLEEIKASKPQFTDKQKDECFKVYRELGEEIRDNMFARTDMQKGLADPHEDLRRAIQPKINASGKIEMLENLGIRVQDGRISRNQACRAWKILGRALGEPTNVEVLRRDKISSTYHSEKSLDELL